MSTSVASVTSHFPSAENGFSTTTSGSVASGATSVGLNSVSGYANGEVVALVIDPTDSSKKQTFTGIVDTAGSQITNVVWTAGTNQSHSAGATVVDYATATHISMISKGLLVQHKQDGTHANTITTDTINENTAAAGVTVDGVLIKDSKINGSYITNATITPTIWTNPYNFAAYHNTTQAVGNGSFAAISFNTEEFDTNSNFSASTYTVPVTGIYLIGAACRTASTTERLEIGIAVGGAVSKRGSALYDSAGDSHAGAGVTVVSLMSLTAGNAITVQALGSSAFNLEGGADVTYFWGQLVHKI